MEDTPRSWEVAGALPQIREQLHRLGLHPGGTWSVSWVVLFAAGALRDQAPAAWAIVGACVSAAAFSGLTVIGSLAFVGRPAPLWLLPAALGLGLLRSLLWLAGGPALGDGFAMLYEPAAAVVSAGMLFSAPLLARVPVTRWALVLGLSALGVLEAADALAPLVATPPLDTRIGWLVLAPLVAFSEICAMWTWIARREVRLERAEHEQRELDDELNRERRTSELLRRKEAWLFDFFERAPDLLLVLAPETSEILRCNRKFSETLGYPRRELVGRSLLDFVEPATLDAVRPVLAHSRRRLRNVSLRLRRHDGGELPVLANLAMRTDLQGVEEVRAVLHDMTSLAGRRRRLDGADDLHRSVTDQLPVGVFRADDTGHCHIVNPSFCELTGLTPERAREHGWLASVHAEDRRRVEEAFRKAASEGVTLRIEHRVTPRAGVEHRVLTECAPDAEGGGFVGSVVLLDGVGEPASPDAGPHRGPPPDRPRPG